MTCRELIEFLHDYDSGELPVDQRICFDQHLAECPECSDYLQSYRQTIHVSREAFCCSGERVSSTVPMALINAILAARVQITRPKTT